MQHVGKNFPLASGDLAMALEKFNGKNLYFRRKKILFYIKWGKSIEH